MKKCDRSKKVLVVPITNLSRNSSPLALKAVLKQAQWMHCRWQPRGKLITVLVNMDIQLLQGSMPNICGLG